MRRFLATVLTLGLLSGFVFAVVLGLLVAFGAVDLAVAVVVLFNAVILLVGPKLNDYLYRFLYDMDWVSFEEFRQRSPESASRRPSTAGTSGASVPGRVCVDSARQTTKSGASSTSAASSAAASWSRLASPSRWSA